MDSFSNIFLVFIIGLNYSLAFIIFPFSLALSVKKIGKFKEIKYKFLLLFTGFLGALSLVGDFIWQNFIHNRIYYEWDNLFFFRYSPLFHEFPESKLGFFEISKGETFEGSWLAKGWSMFYLSLLWISIASVIYFVSIILAKKITLKSKENIYAYNKYINALSVVFIVILLINAYFPVFEIITFSLSYGWLSFLPSH